MRGHSKSSNLHGVIISTTNYGEADVLVTLYTKEQGKVTALAKGSRKMKSRKRASLQMFHDISFQYIDTGGLGIITEATLLHPFETIRLDLRKISLAYFFCEVTKKITPDNIAQPEIYLLLLYAMTHLEKATKLRTLKEYFVKKILEYTGFMTGTSQDPLRLLDEVIERELGSVRIGRMIQ